MLLVQVILQEEPGMAAAWSSFPFLLGKGFPVLKVCNIMVCVSFYNGYDSIAIILPFHKEN